MSGYWFRPKDVGYGATPSNWRGWAFMAALGLVQTGLAPVLLWPSPEGLMPLRIAVWFVAMLALTAAFMAVVGAKTDGEPRRRRGGRD